MQARAPQEEEKEEEEEALSPGFLRIAALAAAVAGCLFVPAWASAATTIGSNLVSDPDQSACGGLTACTYLQTALPTANRAAGGLVAPSDGVVVGWKLKAGSVGGTARLRVLRPATGGKYTGAGTSALENVTQIAAALNSYSTSLPITAGDVLGLDNDTGGNYFAVTTSATAARFSPALTATQTALPTSTDANRELMIQATIEPDCDRDGLGDETGDADLSACSPAVPAPAAKQTPASPPPKGPLPLTGTRVTGTGGPDTIFCGPGNSVVRGLGGNDKIVCGPGNDTIDAGAGNDSVEAGGGRDRVVGGAGADSLRGGAGNDRLTGSSGNDALSGGSGSDRLSGGSGNDGVTGTSGNDRLTGGSGRDSLSAGSGRDRISARDHERDRIDCGSGRDRVTADRLDRVASNCERVARR